MNILLMIKEMLQDTSNKFEIMSIMSLPGGWRRLWRLVAIGGDLLNKLHCHMLICIQVFIF